MSKINNFQSMAMVNSESQFATGIKLTFPAGANYDVDISGSHQRIPTEWQKIPFTVSYQDDGITFQFKKPLNYFIFKIDTYANSPPSFQASIMRPKKYQSDNLAQFLKSKTITFVGCARDCGAKVSESIQLAHQLGSYFGSHQVVIFENDSKDETRSVLRRMASDGSIKLIERDNLDESLPFRTQRLSFARNILLEQVRQNDSDLFCVMDLDGIIGDNFSTEGFLSNFASFDCWDAVFPANTNTYYDIWAFRHDDICPGDYERRLNVMNPVLGSGFLFDICLTNLQKLDFKGMSGWLPVSSAFGGMGIYKTKEFAHSNYFGTLDGYEVCEHVHFHEKAQVNGAMLYINPEFLVNSKV